jgi:hypothetical protein
MSACKTVKITRVINPPCPVDGYTLSLLSRKWPFVERALVTNNNEIKFMMKRVRQKGASHD